MERTMKSRRIVLLAATVALLTCLSQATDGPKRKIIIDQDAAGPAGTDQQSMLVLIQSPKTDVLGITVVTGDQWLKAEVAHTLRMLELIGRSDIPVAPGAEYPLVRMVHKYPHEVTIYAGGPMTNLALAISIDPEFPTLAKELVFMGASLSPITNNPEFQNTPRHEFNIWFDPEAAHIVLRSPWKKIICTPVDISVKTRMSKDLVDRIKAGGTASAKYIAQYTRLEGDFNYLWDELASAAWLDPGIITKSETRYMDIDLGRGAAYGNILTWTDNDKPKVEVQPVEIQVDLDTEKFYKLFVDLLGGPTPTKN